MNLNKSIVKIRVDLQNAKVKKSGKNKFAGFEYYELADFLPKLNELMQAAGVNDQFTINDGVASLTLIKEDEKQVYEMPFVMFDVPLNKSGQPSMQQIQYLGALNTYYKRYLYLNAFGITDGEVIDSMDNSNTVKAEKKEEPNYRVMLSKELEERGMSITEYAAKHGLNAKSTPLQFKMAYDKLMEEGAKDGE